ncbi:efflux RND transporter periplasmic adaptor subunit [Halomonas sp. M20]|uniref:efflux RND transporter periplasmic adaptor subunit n=1 Tax=Halomonas sp. M20 TaxID=2763264 RepID=UPI001D0B3336|nr:efflux RND transporter periplasmic adaptor subunit [Halomonas sp. M20]
MRIASARHGWIAGLLIASLLAGCGSENDQGNDQKNQQQEQPAREAQVMTMERRDIDYDRSYSAKLRSEQQVTIIARVRGELEARNFEPGEMVEKGQSLYIIEPDVYEATVNQRKADLQSAKAQAFRAERDAARYKKLLAQNSVSQQQYDQAVAEKRVAEASVAQAQAALESAKIDLGYSDVQAPVAGMISLSDVNVGNVVDVGTELATITPMNPIEVRFGLPQQEAFDLRRQRQQGADITAALKLPGSSDTKQQQLKGNIDFLGSRVNDDTSTVQARAMFDNPDGLLLPGQFARVQLKNMRRYDVFAVPEIAVTQGLMGPQVYVLDDDNKARTKNVTPGDIAGALQVIADGLESGDRVIVSDPGGIEAGTKIDPQPYSGNPEKLSAQNGDSGGASEQGKQKGQAQQSDAASQQDSADNQADDQKGEKTAEGESSE